MAVQPSIKVHRPSRATLIYNPKVRKLAYQLALALLLAFAVWFIVENTIENLRRSNISTGFGFLRRRAGFDISDSLISYSSDSTYGRAILVGLGNTAVVAIAGIITATILGFIVGIGKLSRNWLFQKLATIYVEIFRNIPPLLVIFFWYLGVLAVLPAPRESIALPFGSYLNNRGFYFPRIVWGDGASLVVVGLLAGVVLTWLVARHATARRIATGKPFPVLWIGLALIVGIPSLAFALSDFPLALNYPQIGSFNLTGGFNVKPEFLSLYLALSFYTAAFIAEIVRAGIQGVNKGQWEASAAVGLRSGQTLRFVIIPQAMRIAIPPLTSQYLGLTKNSSLAIAIGYPDLTSITGTVLNQTGQAIECVLIMMAVYLGLSLATSAFMNWFNAKMALVER